VATDTGVGSNYENGFGQVGKTAGVLFRYVLLGATLFGIVTVSVLLIYVANDAIQPLSADPGWHLVFLLAFVLPSLVTSGYLARHERAALSFGATLIGFVLVSLLFGAGIAIVFIDIVPPLVWLGYVLALALPLAASVGIERLDRRLPFLARFGSLAALLVGSVLLVPGFVTSLPTVPTESVIIAITLGGPIAVLLGRFAARRLDDRRRGLLIGGAGFLAVLAAAFLGPLVGLAALPATILTAVSLVPAAAYALTVALDRPALRVGLSLPAVVLGGALLGAVIAHTLGFAGPESWIDWGFLTGVHDSSSAASAGFYPAIGGSILLMVIVAVLSFPLGVGTAVYLEEYAPDNRFTRIIDINISNLAGVPSVVYGLLGLGLFITYLGEPPGTALVGGATLGLLILPIVIISAREAIRSVPSSMRQASYGMGATRWQTVRNVVLPEAFPGILTGTILAIGRAIGETAPLVVVGLPSVIYSLPTDLSSSIGAMPMQIYSWASLYAGEGFYNRAVPAGVVVLLVVLLAINSIAIVLRNRYQREN
jgi:phosphate transport system permease protein